MSSIWQFMRRLDSIEWSADAVTAAGTVALAFLTLILAFGTFFLWFATRRLVKGTELTAKRQLRAYISAIIDRCDEPETKDGIFTFYLKIKNTGQTPAHDVKIIHITDVFDYPFDKGFDFTLPQQHNPSISFLGPQQETQSESESDPMTAERWREITSDNSGKRLCTYGTLTYRDVFGDPQHVNICTVHLIKIIDLKAGSLRITGQVAERHNDAS